VGGRGGLGLLLVWGLVSSSGCHALPGSAPAPTATRGLTTVRTVVPTGLAGVRCSSTATSGLSLRAGPGQAYPAVLVLVPGAPLVAWSRSGDGQWLVVRTGNGSTGWVAAAFVACSGALPGLPVVPEPPALGTPTRASARP
jgi:uncharacterized protein YraI